MIVIEETPELLKAHVYGKLSLSDYREFEQALTGEVARHGPVDVLLDLTEMTGFSLDAALEDLKFNRTHARDYRRIAVVAGNQWVAWMTWLSGVFTQTDVQEFPDLESASAWLAS